jgi:shikimate dehydrogenase
MSRPVSGVVSTGARRFLHAEVESSTAYGEVPLLARLAATRAPATSAGLEPQRVDIAAIGTTAAKAVRGELLARAIIERGFDIGSAVALPSPEELFEEPTWQLGVVLSPWKQEIGKRCDALGPSALSTGVVDTVVRSPVGTFGFNTNTWAAMTALEVLVAKTSPRLLLLLGSGASARSVALAVARGWPKCAVVIAARSRERAEDLAANFGGRLLEDIARGPSLPDPWDVVVNTTTWGETEASEAEPFGIDLEGVFLPGGRLFDLNNRVSGLQHQALAGGCAVVCGTIMQRVTNACRAALLVYTCTAGTSAQCN